MNNNQYSNLLFVHENNILTKINTNYNKKKIELQAFYQNVYLPMKYKMLSLSFIDDKKRPVPDVFIEACAIINKYYNDLCSFADQHGITSQSKFQSTYYEEISVYLFKDIEEIQNGEFGIFNKGVYAGLKVDSNKNIDFIKKDVDFCIGKKAKISIDGGATKDIIIPIIAVEVKTYLDATMFGEIKSSSRSIRAAVPNSKTYVLLGYKDLKDEHIIAARQDSFLTEMFALRRNSVSNIDAAVLFDYWYEITDAVSAVSNEDEITVPGRLLSYAKYLL